MPKQHYDVEEFKKLLLTGGKGSTEHSIPNVPIVSFGRSPDNQDMSHINRSSMAHQSDLEADLHESSRTSSENIEERAFGTDFKVGSSKNRPPEPKHRHGKLVTANLPQTVSFGDPALSIAEVNSTSDPTNSRTPGQQDGPPLFQTVADFAGSSVDRDEGDTSAKHHKRVPPIPPLTRRQSGRRPLSTSSSMDDPIRSRGISKASAEENSTHPDAPVKSSNVPPPPPPRRSGITRGESSSSIPSIASAATAPDITAASEAQKPSSKTRPPTIPSRSPTISASTASHRTSSSSGSPSVPSAPPPRRRGSSQSSYTPSRLSGDYRAVAERLRSDSGASSISQLQMSTNVDTGTGSERKDVMADLTALQREVDELRGKMRE